MTPRLKTALTLLVGIALGAVGSATAIAGDYLPIGTKFETTRMDPDLGAVLTTKLVGNDKLTRTVGPGGVLWDLDMGRGDGSCTVVVPHRTTFDVWMMAGDGESYKLNFEAEHGLTGVGWKPPIRQPTLEEVKALAR
jgi:hypothetical protein